MTCNNRSLTYYAHHTFDLLHILRIYKSKRVFSFAIKFSTSVIIIICLSSNFLLICSEFIGLKDSKNVRQFANIFGCVSFHTTGLVKWLYCMWKIDGITNLINMLYKCHFYALEICQTDKGKDFILNENNC